MRAFFVTAGMFAGRDALWITDRSGHTTLGMLRTDERDVRRWYELGETPVAADLAIPELTDTNVSANVSGRPRARPPRRKTNTRKCTGRESNPSRRHFIASLPERPIAEVASPLSAPLG